MAGAPTLPVPHTITRFFMLSSRQDLYLFGRKARASAGNS
jgi:hypothetical protein